MSERTSHIGATVSLFDVLPPRVHLTSGYQDLATLAAVASKLQVDVESIPFGKALLWINAFILDGDDVIRRSTLKDSDKEAALASYRGLTAPFRYPFQNQNHESFRQHHLTTERRSFFSLLDQFLQKEHPIYVPSQEQITDLIAQLNDIVIEFNQLDVPRFVKEDFSQQIDLYIKVSTQLPMVAHRLLANESKNLVSWLLFSLPDEAKKTVSKAAIVINVLAAAFVAPAEAGDAASTYYEWFASVSPQPKLIETTVAPKALPAPKKLPLDRPVIEEANDGAN